MPSVQDLTQQSGFIFEAQVEQLGASTASGYAASPETAIVRITRIVKSTSALSGYGGQRVTVHLQSPVSVKAGQQAVFFTHGVHYGDGLVVAELGNSPGGVAAMDAELHNAVEASEDSEMAERLAAAELVVTGTATTPRRYSAPQATAAPVRRVSEHDPDWWISTINVESVEKGAHTAKTADVLFANSMDIAWYHSPKIKEGDHGVFLFHSKDLRGRAVPARAATHPLDFRPMAETSRVRNLLK
jgi:hypothetical protein